MIELNPFTASALYDFSAAGPGTFTFEPVSSFQVTSDTVGATPGTVRLDITNARSVTVTVTGDVSKRSLRLDKRVEFGCRDSGRALFILNSYIESIMMAANAIDYINRRGEQDQVYIDYFGTNKRQNIISIFEAVAKGSSIRVVLDCSDPHNRCGGKVFRAAYTDTDTDTHLINYCPAFFGQSNTTPLCNDKTKVDDNMIRGSTTISQLLQAFGKVTERTIECPDARNLNEDKERASNSASYGVSPQTPLDLPKARTLTWAHILCSASLPRPGTIGSAVKTGRK